MKKESETRPTLSRTERAGLGATFGPIAPINKLALSLGLIPWVCVRCRIQPTDVFTDPMRCGTCRSRMRCMGPVQIFASCEASLEKKR